MGLSGLVGEVLRGGGKTLVLAGRRLCARRGAGRLLRSLAGRVGHQFDIHPAVLGPTRRGLV